MEYKDFGVMLCSASNGIMNIAKLKEFVDVISSFGYNVLELCIDDMLEVENEAFFGYLRGRYSKQEIRDLEDYAKSKNVEIVPCIQVLAHLNHITKLPYYSDIVDTPGILLVDEPKTYTFLNNVLKSVSETFTSRKINIGYDEAHTVGLGTYLDKHGYTNRYDLLLRHLDRVIEMTNKYGLKVHMWSDMFFRLASQKSNEDVYAKKGMSIPKEVRDKVPNGVGLCFWEYGSVDEELYDDMFKAHEEFNREVWFAGTAWTCRGFVPQNIFSLESLAPAMKQVIKHNVQHVLITMWGDDGNQCSYFSALPTLYAARQFADGNFDMDKIKNGFEEITGVKYDDFLLMDTPNLNEYNHDLKKVDSSSMCFLYNDCFLGLMDPVIKEMKHIPFKEYKEKLMSRRQYMKQYAYLFDKVISLCNVLELKTELGIRTRNAYETKNKEALKAIIKDYNETINRIKEFKEIFRREWMLENKSWNWNVHEIRLSGLMARMSDCVRQIEEYINGETSSIDELEEKLLVYAPRDWYPNMNYHRLTFLGY